MTPKSRRELLRAVRPRYVKASRADKSRILYEFVATTGHHRTYAIRLLRRGAPEPSRRRRRGRKSPYRTPEVMHALVFMWETCDRICSRRLHPHLPEMVAVLEQHGELVLSQETKTLLLAMGRATINHHLYRYCEQQRILFARSRPYHKNDQAHVEQKNWSVVRRQVGYDRYDSPQALAALNELDRLMHWYVSFFLPVLKVQAKTRVGGKVKKEYDPAQTSYQRVLASPAVSEEVKAQLGATHHSLNPVTLRWQIDRQLDRVWSLATE